ncbi:MAG: OmpA family protein [Fusobacterium perfoetens]|uniref:OmpA family protein n=1 Tax=Fusobacterium perfoetens TaxID=852 RepID=UPI0023F0C5AF|nr:OmpA family protein [Fusobacterium perfoetens]MCI6152676.1 OmpA family protein [Fusobacterium perfoetens]MDY3237672.1 OmpA family protein [Fusobacterium perfoetens]
MINKVETEKALKKYLKKKGVYSFSVLVGFLITGSIVLGAEFSLDERQELLKSEKEKIAEKILELRKDLFVIKNAQDKSTHIITSVEVGRRSGHLSGSKSLKKEEPNIDIPDIRDDIKPNVPDIKNPLPNEDSIVKEPDFKFDNVGEVAVNDKLPDIDLNLGDLTMPVESIDDDKFNTLTNGVSTPEKVEVSTNVNIDNIKGQPIKTDIVAPTINEVKDLSNFVVGEINVNTPNVTTPDSFSLDTVKIKSGSFVPNDVKPYHMPHVGNNEGGINNSTYSNYIVKNYTRYRVEDGKSLNMWVNRHSIFYAAEEGRKANFIINDGNNSDIILSYDGVNKYAGDYNTNTLATTYISDVIGKDVSVEGTYNISYEGNRPNTPPESSDYVRIFLSSLSKGLNETDSDKIKLTEFSGTLNLSSTNKDKTKKLYVSLVGMEHQLWDNPNEKNSILLNTGKINIGEILDLDNSILENKNMIGIVIDSAGSGGGNKSNQTINAGEINILQKEGSTILTQGNIGISFEEYENNVNNKDAKLKDEVYIGNINIGNGTTKNYGFKMGNIYSNSSTYFDETKIIGKVDGDKIHIDNPDKSGSSNSTTNIKTDENGKQYVDYTSDIVVAGSQNAGMVVGKSLSNNASDYIGTGENKFETGQVNPIANFENISIKVDGDQTIGFVRDKNYSNNNKNDMVITSENLNNVRFGVNAKNSVLFRSEMYGITNETTIKVTPEDSGTTTKEKTGEENSNNTPTYNVAMQAMAQTWDKDGTKVNSSGSVTNGENGEISGEANNMIGMMASGTVDNNVTVWQNNKQASEALATNKGTISLAGDNNIGMAIMDDNKGSNSGTIEISGANGVGIYNIGTFENKGTVDKKAIVNVNGANGIGIYNNSNNNSLTLENSDITIGGENSVGIYSEGGTINFIPNTNTTPATTTVTIKGKDNAVAGIYTKTKDTNITGNVNITGTKVGLVSNGVTTNVSGNLGYSGDGFALYTKGEKGKIVFDSNSTLTLGGSAYGFDIVDTTKQGETPKQYIDFNGANIEIKSNDVTLFNINGNGTEYSSNDITSEGDNLPGEKYLEPFVGKIGSIINSYEINGETITYDGYKIASIENGNILLNSTLNNNNEFLKKYKFQKSKINMSTDTNLTLSNDDANTYFSGEVIGIGISSNKSKDGEKATEIEDTQINIISSTLTANRVDKAPEISQENKNTKSTIGAYIDYGIINIGEKDKAGHIVVENDPRLKINDTVNDNGIGIFSKNGSTVAVNEGSSITVYGNNGIGIYGEATKDGKDDKNKFGGTITLLNIDNKGTINVSSGTGGVGIFADGGTTEAKGIVTNSGTIKVGGGTKEDSSVGIYGINTDITNTGSITVGSNTNNEDSTGVGIYAENSNVILGDKTSTDKKVEFTLGDGATGIYLDGDSNLTLENELVFNSLNPKDSVNTTNRIGIYATNKATGGLITLKPSKIEINKNIDMSNVIGGKAVVVDGRDVTNTSEITISGNNGRGIRVLDNGTITNNGTITSNGQLADNNPSSIGMVAANKNGTIANNGTINIGSTNGIGIYVDNTNNTEEDKNSITSIGNINLNNDNTTGIVLKGTDITLGENGITSENISFNGIKNNRIGIYGDSSEITINKEISKTTLGKDNIIIAGKNGSTITNNNTITITITSNNKDNEHNIGVYLDETSSYTGRGKVVAENGAIGIYSDSNKALSNVNVEVNSNGVQTIGVVLNNADTSSKVDKNISGNITLKGAGEGKAIGVYANNSNVIVDDTLTLNNDKSNGTGLYLNDSTLSGNGTIKITGEGKIDSTGKIPNSVGIYYTSSNKDNPINFKNEIKVEIDKSNTIGVYVANESTLTKESGGEIKIGNGTTQVENVTGLVASTGSIIDNKGAITLNNTSKSIGIASLGGEVNNSGIITLTNNTTSGTGVFLSGGATFNGENGTIKIENIGDKNGVGIGIYVKDNGTISNTGNFEMASGNIAIYSDGADINTNINLVNGDKNSGTTALVVKSDKDSTEKTIVGGTSKDDKMKITLAKGSTGIYALDSGVSISNVSIDAKAHNTTDELSYGIYLKSEANGNYNISNTDISLVKGIGIVVGTSEKDKNTKLTLSESTINVDSYSEGDKAETGIGIYTNSGVIALTGGNTINTSYGVGIYGGNGSNITTSAGDVLNLQGYSVGVYSKGGNVTLGQNTEINFQQGQDYAKEKEITSKGVGAYVIDGTLTSNANINLAQGNDKADGIVGLLGKQSGAIQTKVTNNGIITLSGKSVVGMAGIGLEANTDEEKQEKSKVTITNSGNITISGTYSETEKKANLSTGIYGKDANIINGGTISVGNYATGIYYTGTKANDITNNGTINISGTESTGIVLNGIAGNVSLGDIKIKEEINSDENKNRNLGVYLNNYSSESTNIGNITLGSESLGLYINNSSTTINKVGDITIGTDDKGTKGIGIASVGKTEDGSDTVTIVSNGKITVGAEGTAIYVKDTELTMASLSNENIKVGKGGTFIRVNGGTLNLENTSSDLTFDGNIGMIIENGGDIKSTSGQEISNITVTNGGTGILIKGETTGNPSILAPETTISLGSGKLIGKDENGVDKYSYSVGVYYQNSNAIENGNRLDIELKPESQDGVHHTIGTIYDRTYGTINNFNTTMNNDTSYSIGTIIRRDTKKGNYTGNDENNKVVLNAGKDKILVNVNGNHNIGIIGKNSIIKADGDIKVGLAETSKESIGVYLTANDEKWIHSYTGTGDIEVGSHSYGIYAKSYNVTHNGDIKATGEGSIGIASIEKEDHTDTHTVTVNDGTITVSDGAIGVFGRDTNIEVINGDLVVSGENTTGIASLQNGNITYNGTADISGKGTAGIYKNTVGIKDGTSNTITVGTGDWEINNLATGIMAISRTKNEDGAIKDTGNSITIDNASNMTLGDGSIGIYSAGKNTVTNSGNISVGGTVMEGDKTYASVGIYMANGVGGTGERAIGTNSGTITVANNGGAGVQVAGYVDFTNNGKIDVSNGGVGIHASYGAIATNDGEITVTGKGTGMIATGKGSQAINNGTINLEKGEYSYGNNDNLPYNTLLIGMGAINGGTITNGEKGIININDGIGMYIDSSSFFENKGTLNVNNGVGIMGVGELKNTGTINVTSSNGTGTVELDKNLSDKGSLVVDNENGILEVNDNFSNIGGILETDYNIKLNNPTIDITAGGAGFIAPEMSGDIKLDSNFALEGNGLSYTVEDFIDPSADININTSPLFDTELVEGDLTVSKVDYKDISVGDRYDNIEDSLDNILANGGKDSDVLKNLNYYLDSLGNTTIFNSEYNRIMGEVTGLNTYSNLQSRMQDISRVYDNSFKELIGSGTTTYENSKFNIIYTDNEYTNNNENIAGYKYYTKGLNYMKEFDGLDRYGYTLGFVGTEFKFDGSATEEDVYSLRGGIHRIKEYDNGITFTTRGDIGYNYHRMDRNINNNSINRKAHYGSYQIGLDNQLRKPIFIKDNSNVGIYTGLNLEYGIFEHIKEKGDIGIEVKSNDYFSSKAMLGFNGNISKNLGEKWRVSLLGDVNYSYDFGTNYDENRVRTINDSTGYSSLEALEKTRGVLAGEIGVNFDKEDYLTIGLKGRTERDFERDEDYWSVGLTFTFRFNDYGIPENLLNVKSLFGFDKDKADDKELESVKEVAQYVKDNKVDGKILIEGHTDSTGREKYNKDLSERRVKSIEKEVTNILGDSSKVETRIIETKAYGETKPAVSNSTKEGRAQNRRVEVSIIEK